MKVDHRWEIATRKITPNWLKTLIYRTAFPIPTTLQTNAKGCHENL